MCDTMERPTKRPRLSIEPGFPEEVPEEWDLRAARAQNDLRLKSIFEGIFTKYGKDFSETGDEIDLETGNIVVDNGHLQGMREENDTGDKATWHSVDGDDSEDDKHDLNEDEYGGRDQLVDWATPYDDLGVSETGSDDSILDSAVKQPDSPKSRVKTYYEGQSSLVRTDKESGPRDPLWQVPEIPRVFSTPTVESRQVKTAFSPRLPLLNRERSPPGSGSLWSIPRRGRPRTEGKPRVTPSKRQARIKVTSHSSPVARDWSFAEAPDGDESDDPLQEFQPSPSPSKLTIIRSKSTNHPQSSFKANLQAAKRSTTQSELSQSDLATPKETERRDDIKTLLDEEGDPRKQTANHAGAQSHSQACRKPPSQSNKIYDGMTPDEAKRIVCVRYVQNKPWKEILAALPGRRMSQVLAFNHHHWSCRRRNPPELSAAWSQNELKTLRDLEDPSGLSWSEIKSRFPGRSRVEIEVELLRLWVGDEVWFDGGDAEKGERDTVFAPDGDTEHDEESTENPPEPTASTQRSTTTMTTEIPKFDPFTPSKKRSCTFEDFLGNENEDGGKDEDEDIACSNASSPSKLSAILLDSPAHSRAGSRTPSRRASPAKRVKLTS